MITRKQASVEVLTAFAHNPPLLWLFGMLFLIAGLGIVLGHNVWSGGALPVIVTIIGWGTLIRGLLLLFLSPEAIWALFRTIRYEQLFYVYVVISLVLGAYLTYGGFRARRALDGHA